jgi:hypothetical protein
MRGGSADDRQQRCSACKFAPDSPLEEADAKLASAFCRAVCTDAKAETSVEVFR